MELKIKKLSENTILPTKAHDTDACFDIYACIKEPVFIWPGETRKIPTGFCTEIPRNYYCAIYARSGMGINKGLRLANSVGIIDSEYRGEWVIALHNDSDTRHIINNGDRIAQFIMNNIPFCELIEVEEVQDSTRGSGGLGSSGK